MEDPMCLYTEDKERLNVWDRIKKSVPFMGQNNGTDGTKWKWFVPSQPIEIPMVTAIWDRWDRICKKNKMYI